jgi:hypothetical protein
VRAFLTAAAAIGIVASAASVGFGQAKPAAAPSIVGVWRTTSAVTTGANPSSNTKIPASIVIYTKSHYSIVEMNNPRQKPAPAPPKVAGKLTDAEKLALYEDWLAPTVNSGTYEIKGTTLTRRPLVAKGSPTPPAKTYADAVRELKFEGNNTMIQIAKSADGKSETRRTYMRLE